MPAHESKPLQTYSLKRYLSAEYLPFSQIPSATNPAELSYQRVLCGYTPELLCVDMRNALRLALAGVNLTIGRKWKRVGRSITC